MSPPRFAEVAFPLPLDQTFTYAVPEALQDRAALGMRVLAPFGKRVETGYVTALSETSDRGDVRLLIDFPDETPVFSEQMLDLCRWVARYYCCSLGEALQCAAPAGLKQRTKLRYTLIPEQLTGGRYTDRQRKVIAELHRRGPRTEGQLAKTVGARALSNTLQALTRRGIVLAEPVTARPAVSIKTETYVQLVEAAALDPEACEALMRRAPKQAGVYLDLLNGEPEQRAAALYERHQVNASILRALEKKGLVQCVERELFRTPEYDGRGQAEDKLALNGEQQAAYDAMAAALDEGRHEVFLLYGVTGSGKTEVYLQAIEHALALGRSAIILVPEISLTPQTVARFYARFKKDIAVLHSALGAGERYDEWRRAQRGEVKIVVGARSAIFAPVPHLGIVVIDEEHDTSYKQNEAPRYHARDVAIVRAIKAKAVCVLGSATPAVESYYNSERAKSTRLELKRRATEATLPQAQLVDMRIETKEQGGQVILSQTLEDEVRQCVGRGEQVILLLNRRGHSPFVLCPMCSWVARCQDCNVSLTYHARDSRLHCHYCGHEDEQPQVCGECGFNPLIYLGTGTQKVEEYLVRAFADCRIERMDRDTTAGKGGHAKILGRFAEGGIDILIGTQMIAKGHDYPGVTLVGVINADAGLSMPDFRAAETAFQLLTQVAGRAGRGQRPGKVVIQTYRPHHYAVQAAAQHDYLGFYAQELAARQDAGYPPLRRMVNFGVECEDMLVAERSVAVLQRKVYDAIRDLEFRGLEVIGPAPAPISRMKKKYRWNLAALSKSAQRINTLCRVARKAFFEEVRDKRVQLKVDLDPYDTF